MESAAKIRARLKWELACERLSFVLDPPEGSSTDPLDLDEAVRLAHAALEEARTAFGADSAGLTGVPTGRITAGTRAAEAYSRDDSAAGGTRKVTLGGDYVHARTGESVTYQVDLDHGPETTYYAARVLLLGETWHELESGTIAGSDQNVRTPQVMQAVHTQIDVLDMHALNRGS